MAKAKTAATSGVSNAPSEDQVVLELIKQVKDQKAEIASIEKPQWKTNCSFTVTEGDLSKATNLHTVSDVSHLLKIAGFLIFRAHAYAEAAVLMGVEKPPAFTWQGYVVDDWTHDLKLRLDKLGVAAKQQKLAILEGRLDKLISPELRRKLELEAIQAEMSEG